MNRVKLFSNLEREIAHSDEVEGILGDHAFEILTRARANLAAHTKTGKHKVTQTKGKVDHFVNLEGPAAVSVELGHFDRNGNWVRGIGIFAEIWGGSI